MSAPVAAAPRLRAPGDRMPRLVVLDPFWPGRRPYLFDGFCRSLLLR
ncbi:hypothetical protein ACFFKU_14355 [Kineococcus gynurae]|uniref:Uncharacterized protein n=1 Tax=Kineococcus gynurae TaxID=452979 RepID=A0ABV5LTX8_9ACTN